ncbi:non-ribosomal peptide synthetase [Coccidioides posadasii str. Silveira]|uniref:Nonribosomal peptide synthetase sidC n=2 Tax=Coccidioides posadasii (strain RMSCC 757 / Silveira) TaxID=443226 RepID=E9DDK0_COCPS|nr:non-ribosomal peptide synthetase [Coccidioides posadasii str. Silveira]
MDTTYISFPKLDYVEESVDGSVRIDWNCGISKLSLDLVACSWAAVLAALTGEEIPAFSLNGDPVKVDLEKNIVLKAEVDDLRKHGHTGSPEPADGCLVEVRCYLEQGTGHIIASNCTTRAYLSQIGTQFENHIRAALQVPTNTEGLRLSILNEHPQLIPGPLFLHDLVQNAGRGLDLALEFLDKDRKRHFLTYDQLHLRSKQLALRLSEALRSRPASAPIVPVLIPQSPDLYVSWLGILRSGAAVCPLNIDAPSERVNFIVNDVAADVVVTVKSLAGRFDQVDRPLIIILADDDANDIILPATLENIKIYPESLAYVMYTSGSTGLPKGVGLSHLAATQAILAHDDHIPYFRRFLQFAAPTFDVSVFEIFFPLFRGSTLVACERSLMLNDLVGVMNHLEVDGAELTPTVAGELLRQKSAVPSLKVLLTIGEMLTRRVVDEFGFSGPNDGVLYAMYGPTEATIHCTIAPKLPVGSRVGNIGIPFTSVSAFIIPIQASVDGEPDVLPVGCIGELAVGGPQLANGYLNRPEENRKAFIDSQVYGRLYRTGDKARLHPNGELECLGRISSGQVKLRGQRMELGEVESTIYKSPGVRSAAACVADGILVAFVSRDTSLDPAAVRQVCEKWLPKFMVPTEIICMDELPRLPSGKIDRKALESNYTSSKESDVPAASSFASEVEENIGTCVEHILHAPIGRSGSLAALGLDSLKAIRLASELRAISVNLDVTSILEADSVQGIALAMERSLVKGASDFTPNLTSSSWDPVVDITHKTLSSLGHSSTPQDVLPCSPMQVSMIAESMQSKRAYSNWIEVEFGNGISPIGIRSAFRLVADRNEILRSGFVEVNMPGHPYAQVVWESLDDSVFVECDTFHYDMVFQTPQHMLHPFQIQLKSLSGEVRALVHIHHALYDGWSWEHVMNDLGTSLEKKLCKQRPQYRTFVDHISSFLSSRNRLDSIDYWRDLLQGISPSPWPNFQDHNDIPHGLGVTQRTFSIDINDLDAATRNLRISRQTFFQGALGYLLGEYNGTSDVIFGSVSSGRTIPVQGIEDVIGPCINTLPVRFNFDNLRNVQDLLATIHNLNRKSLTHGLLPLRDIKAVSGVEPSLSLFDTLFVWQDTLNGHQESSTIVKQVASADFLEFCLTLEVEIKNDVLCAKATFQESTLSTAQVDIFLRQLDELASIFIHKPDLSLKHVNDELPISVLSAENVRFTSCPGSQSLSDGVKEVAALDPERTAVEFLETFDPDLGAVSIQKLTYAELNTRSGRLAKQLRSFGIGSGSLVSIVLEKSLGLYVSILAVVDAGAGYVPITPQTPTQRALSIISEASCRVCITSPNLLASLELPHDIMVLDSDGNLLRKSENSGISQKEQGMHVAYAIFTSGSTGVPKGVLVSHENMRENIAVLSEIYPTPPGSKMLQACSPAFDVSVFEIFFTWAMGMTLCSATNDIIFRDIEGAIRTLEVTHLSLTPSVAALVRSRNVPKVQFLVTAGEALTPEVAKEWADVGVYQGYGPCETTNICTVKPRVRTTDLLSNIGKPFKNTSAFVLSQGNTFSPVPRGAVGELCFGGKQVALGYLNMPDVTREKFVEHPEYGKVYRSGDYGRMLPDGSLAFVGRRDDLVKLRGQRIELGEVNSAILQSRVVKSCTTLICGDKPSGSQLLVSFWVPVADSSPYIKVDPKRSSILTKELYDTISKILPMYMIPSFILPIETIPVTVNGKVDKRLLADMYSNAAPDYLDLFSNNAEISDNSEELSETESKIVQLVAAVTNTPATDIGRHSSFYRLGMDSILAVSLSRQLKLSGFGQVDVSVIMKNDTVSRLAAAIDRVSDTATTKQEILPNFKVLFSPGFIEKARHDVDMAQKKIRKILPCTPLQEAMLSQMVSSDQKSYFNHLIFEVRKDMSRLKFAWEAMVARHDILRTWFQSTNDAQHAFAQIVLDTVDLPWSFMECSSANVESIIERRKVSILSASGVAVPYAFIELHNITTGKAQLHLLIHHALYDGEAMGQLLQEVEQVVLDMALPPVVPFDHYIEHMIKTDVEAATQFWNSHLTGFSPTYLVSPVPNASATKHKEFHSVSIDLDIPLTQVAESCKNASVTLLSLLQAAWAKLLFFYSETSDICFGDVASCRTLPVNGAERIVGPCFNTLPLRVKLDSNTVNSDLMLQLRKFKADVLPYQLTSLRRLQSQFSPSGSRLFDTLLLLQKEPQRLNEEIWTLVDEHGDMDFPFICEIVPNPEKDVLQVCLYCDGSKTSLDSVRQMLGGYVESIHHTLQYPSARATDTSVVKSGIPPFINISRPIVEKETMNDDLREWSNKALEIRELVSELAKVERKHIKLNTTIYKLGLDSINAIQIAANLRAKGYEISAGDILEAPTISQIASRLEKSTINGECSIMEAFDFNPFQARHWVSVCTEIGQLEAKLQSVRPCTTVQTGMLALFVNSGGNLYFNHMCLQSTRPLDIDALKSAWEAAVDRNEMLRTGFCQVKDEVSPFAMITYKPGTLDLPWHDYVSENGQLLHHEEPTGIDILNRLHYPAWFLTVQSLPTYTTIRFSALHALYDAHSLNLILSEVARQYNGGILFDPIPISPVLGSILTKGAEKDEITEKIWEELCKGWPVTKFPDLNPIRTDRREMCTVSKTSSESLSTIYTGCTKAEVTLQAAGQAAWARLLASYVGEIDIGYGVVLSGRDMSAAAQDVVFPCLTTVPSRYRVEGSNRELVQAVMKLNAHLIKGQHVPLSKLQRMTGSDTALFDTLFVHQKFVSSTNDEQFWTVTKEIATTDYPVSIELIPKGDQLEFCVTFRNDILPVDQAHILIDQLEWLLFDTIFSPESNCAHFMGADRRITCVLPRKDAYIEAPVDLLHQFVEVNASKCPSKIALEFASRSSEVEGKLIVRSWTYKEFNDQGNKYANLLLQLGASKSKLIGICFDKCPEAYFAILAILKVGSAYVALDPGAPIARKKFIMEDSGSNFLLCTSDKKEELMGIDGVKVLALDEAGLLNGLSSSSPILEHSISGDDTCYCLYTSGSTGTPKGCEITHSNAIQAMLSFQRLFAGHWDDSSRWLQFASFHFDVSVLEQYWSWSVGICVTSCPRDILFEDLAGVIRQLEITHIDLTPSLARLLQPDEVPSLCRGVFITGGEALKQEILDTWGEKQVIYNGYGPTEVTIGCTMLPRVTQWDKPSNIGPQFDNVGSFVFKPGTNIPVLRGGIGELCVSGPLVGRGYLNRPELTEERFQYLDEWGERVYRTGDLVRMLHDESFCFLGRMDDQVKLRGQRLEIDEINHVIKSASAEIGEVVTMVLKHLFAGKEQLVSFITRGEPSEKEAILGFDTGDHVHETLNDIRRCCSLQLPGYMVPTHVIPLTRFPLSPNNKIENKKLKEIYANLTLEQMQKLSPQNEENTTNASRETKKIISIVSRLAGCDETIISPWSNIFQLGLDSISVISLARSLKEAGFSTAQSALIMKNPVISALSEILRSSNRSESSDGRLYQNAKQAIAAFAHKHLASLATELCVSINAIEAVCPCSPLQDGMIYKCLESASRAYVSNFTFELLPDVDIVQLMAAWRKVQETVQILRTKFPVTADGYAQVVLREDKFPWFEFETTDSSEVSNISRDRYMKWRSTLHHFNDRLWEIGVVSGPSSRVMCLNIFHGLYDGNSLPLLLERVAEAYFNVAHTETPSYIDVLPLGPFCRQPDAQSFWTRHLRDASARTIPSNPNSSESEVHILAIEIPAMKRLEEVRRRLNVTEQAVVHGCWLYVFEKHFGFVPTLGIVSSGRALDFDGADKAIGPLFNTIPCHVPFFGLDSLSELVQACHDFHVSAIPFQHTPLRDIMKWTGRSADNPLFDSLFVFQKDLAHASRLGSSLWSPTETQAEADYPLAFEARDDGGESLTTSIVGKGQILTSKAIGKLLSQFKDTLLGFLDDQSIKLQPSDDISILNHTAPSNGVKEKHDSAQGPLTNGTSKFEWSAKAKKLRQEISRLANTDDEAVSENTSILELGLDSIDAIKLSSRMKNLGISLPVSRIMHCRTIKSMMKEVVADIQRDDDSFKTLISLEKALRSCLEADNVDLEGIDHILPATPLQEGMLAEMIGSDYSHYFNHDVLEIEPHVDVDKLRNAFVKAVEESPILRTTFAQVSDPSLPFAFAQLVYSANFKLNWKEIDMAGRSIDDIFEQEKLEAIKSGLRSPPFRLRFLRSGAKRLLLISIAHALYDGWSLDLFHQTIATLYLDNSYQRPSYHSTLEHIINSASNEKALQFWKGYLEGVRPVSFPEKPGSNTDEIHRDEIAVKISCSNVIDFCKSQGITPQTLGLTCWLMVLAGYLRQLDVVCGTVMLGRDTVDGEQVMFPTMNSVAIRGILHGSRREMLQYVQEMLGLILNNQHFPLRKVKALSRIGAKSLFDTLFIYQKRPGREEKVLYKSVQSSSDVEYPVCTEMELSNDSVIWRVACKSSVLSSSDTASLLDRIENCLLELIHNPNEPTVDFRDESATICGLTFSTASLNGVKNSYPLDKENSLAESWTPLEEAIRSILSSVANISEAEVTKDTTLFHIGLDSISAIKVASLLRKRSITLAVSDMLRAGTVRKMAEVAKIAKAKKEVRDSKSICLGALKDVDITTLLRSHNIQPGDIEGVFPATSGQVYMLKMWERSNGAVFFPDFFYRVGGDIAAEELERRWDKVIRQVPILRTEFFAIGNHDIPFVQVVFRATNNPIAWRDKLRDLLDRQQEGASKFVTLYASRQGSETIVRLHIHHALYDAVSLEHIVSLLSIGCPNGDISLRLKTDISEFVAFNTISSPLEARKAFWTTYLTKASLERKSLQETLIDWPGMTQNYRPSLIADVGTLDSTSRKLGVSIQALFLAVYAKMHIRFLSSPSHSALENLVIGLYLANRSHAMDGLPELVAPTLNIVPLCIGNPTNRSVTQLARAIQSDLHEISNAQNSCVSLHEIAEWTGVTLDTVVNFLRYPDPTGDGDGALHRLTPLEESEIPEALANGSIPNATSNSRRTTEIPLGSVTALNNEQPGSENRIPSLEAAYKPSVDIEVAIRNNALDVGIFGPKSRLDSGLSDTILGELKQELLAVSRSEE